ncbi:hypothetical protein MIND_00923900 [Mycena indigotica]|uniref:GATA-type domain-containing protein n=1 Tax=Mycena indigotica TaxID=2126181 RepID=A0A8H6SDV1_9AGAR|nr:uncharacterized protein MIND_00923900 [Mycena indigotica]KAF7296921.1 hypothetical protein MIND_00923900 [Mycena indigotica]
MPDQERDIVMGTPDKPLDNRPSHPRVSSSVKKKDWLAQIIALAEDRANKAIIRRDTTGRIVVLDQDGLDELFKSEHATSLERVEDELQALGAKKKSREYKGIRRLLVTWTHTLFMAQPSKSGTYPNKHPQADTSPNLVIPRASDIPAPERKQHRPKRRSVAPLTEWDEAELNREESEDDSGSGLDEDYVPVVLSSFSNQPSTSKRTRRSMVAQQSKEETPINQHPAPPPPTASKIQITPLIPANPPEVPDGVPRKCSFCNADTTPDWVYYKTTIYCLNCGLRALAHGAEQLPQCMAGLIQNV